MLITELATCVLNINPQIFDISRSVPRPPPQIMQNFIYQPVCTFVNSITNSKTMCRIYNFPQIKYCEPGNPCPLPNQWLFVIGGLHRINNTTIKIFCEIIIGIRSLKYKGQRWNDKKKSTVIWLKSIKSGMVKKCHPYALKMPKNGATK